MTEIINLESGSSTTRDNETSNHNKTKEEIYGDHISSDIVDDDDDEDNFVFPRNRRGYKPRNIINQKEKTAPTKNNANTNNQSVSSHRPKEANDLISNKRSRNKQIITGIADTNNSKYAAVPVTKRIWIHVSNFHKNLTTDDMLELLKDKYNKENFICYKIKPKHRAPTYSSFKIGADASLKEQLLNPSSWNRGITVTAFDFFRAARNKVKFERKEVDLTSPNRLESDTSET